MSHWYCLVNGVPQRYVQLKKDGTESKRINRKKAIADLAVESVNTILDKATEIGGLLTWAGRLAVQAGVDAGDFNKGMELFTERREAAANRGTEFHNAIEAHLKGAPLPEDSALAKACVEAKKLVDERGIKLFDSEVCIVFHGKVDDKEYHFGGTPDVACKTWILDWKTVGPDGREPKLREAAQLAAYRLGSGNLNARCANVYFNRDTGDVLRFKEWTDEELAAGWELFTLAYRVSELNDRFGG